MTDTATTGPMLDGIRWVTIGTIKTPHLARYREGRRPALLCGAYQVASSGQYNDIGPAGPDDPSQPGACVRCLAEFGKAAQWAKMRDQPEPEPAAEPDQPPPPAPVVALKPVEPQPPVPAPAGRTLVITEHRGGSVVARPQEPAALVEAERMATACENFIRAFYTGKFPLPPEGMARLFDLSSRIGAFRALNEHGVMVDVEPDDD